MKAAFLVLMLCACGQPFPQCATHTAVQQPKPSKQQFFDHCTLGASDDQRATVIKTCVDAYTHLYGKEKQP